MKYALIVVFILIVIILVFLILKILPLLTAKPVIKVDYVAEYNKIAKPDNYDPAENAAPYYDKAFEVLEDMSDSIKDMSTMKLADMDEIELEILSNWLLSNSQAIDYLRQAAQKPYYWVERYGQDDTLLSIAIPEISKIRSSVICLGLYAKLMAHQGKIETAMDCVADLLQIGAHLLGPKTLIEQLVGIATYEISFKSALAILSEDIFEQTTLANFQTLLEDNIKEMAPLNFSSNERIYALNVIQGSFTDDGNGNGRLIPGALYKGLKKAVNLRDGSSKAISYCKAILICLNHPNREQTIQLSNMFSEHCDSISKQTPWQLHQAGTSYFNENEKLTKDNYFIHGSSWSLSMVCEISHRPKTTGQALITTIALLRYKGDMGSFPASLQELVSSNYIKELPMDPYSEEPLVYKRTEGNFILYSVGANFKDDSGVHSDNWERDDHVFWPVKSD